MKRKKTFLGVAIAVTSIFSACGGSNSTQELKGVKINGVTWATTNIGASNPEYFGKCFTWKKAQTACPKGWRLPTSEELKMFANGWGNINIPSKWTTLNSKNGYEFGYDSNTIFLPAAGFNDFLSSGIFAGAFGYYWSSTEGSNNDVLFPECSSSDAYFLNFSSNGVSFGYYGKNSKLSVRCVKE